MSITDDFLKPVELVPVAQWVYDLFRVDYTVAIGSPVVKSIHIAASSEGHLDSLANEYCPAACNFFQGTLLKENVGQPRIVGQMYGFNVYEDGVSHGTRLTAA